MNPLRRLIDTIADLAARQARQALSCDLAARDRQIARLETLLSDAAETSARIIEVADRITGLEQRLLSYYRFRHDAIDMLADYLVGTQIPGDYVEFGVFRGTVFAYAFKIMASLFREMRFIAFNSFEGLPAPQGVDAASGYTSGFHQGQFSCTEPEFIANLTAAGVDLNRVVICRGWFDQTLRHDNPETAGLGKVAAAWVDCDLYELTVPVLEFLTGRLSVGSVLLFDDWRCFRNLPDFGEQRACREWLERHPRICLNPFIDFGFHGKSFTVAAC